MILPLNEYVDFPFMVKSFTIKTLTSKNSDLFFIYQLLNNRNFIQEDHLKHYISAIKKKVFILFKNEISNLIRQSYIN